jgi:hypothetical protein
MEKREPEAVINKKGGKIKAVDNTYPDVEILETGKATITKCKLVAITQSGMLRSHSQPVC